METRYAVLTPDGELVGVFDESADAEHYAGEEVGPERVWMETADRCAVPNAKPTSLLALRAAHLDGAKDAQDRDRVLALEPAEAWAQIRHHFPHTGTYSTPALAADALLGQNYKTSKTIHGFDGVVYGLSLAPFWKAFDVLGDPTCAPPKDLPNLCIGSSPECRQACLVLTGQNVGEYAQAIKLCRTHALIENPVAFARMLAYSVERYIGYAQRKGLKLLIRLNVYSDVPWEAFLPWLFEEYPEVQFCDYTKVPRRETPANYDLTFSYSGANEASTRSELRRGRRASVVFLWPRKKPLPSGFEFWGQPVVDGDISDLRPLDPEPCVVGLRFKTPKGVKAYDVGAFVVRVQETSPGVFVAASSARQAHAEQFQA